LKPNRWGGYLLLGLCAGLGTLSKYNYVLVYAGLLAGALTLRAWRPLILNRRMFAALLVHALIVAPNLVWIYHHTELATSSVYKLKMAYVYSLGVFAAGVEAWLGSCVDHVAPLLGIFVVLVADSFRRCYKDSTRREQAFGKRLLVVAGKIRESVFPRLDEPSSDGQQLLWRMFAAAGVVIAVMISVFAVTDIEDQWMQPIMAPMPVFVALAWRQSLTAWRVKTILWLGALVTVVIAVGASGRILLTETLVRHNPKKYEILNAPFRPLAADMKAELAPYECIFANDRWLAGNLRIWFQDKTVTIPEMTQLFKPSARCALIWDAGRGTNWRSLGVAEKTTGNLFGNAKYFEAQPKYFYTSAKTNTMRLGVECPTGEMDVPGGRRKE